MDWVCLPCDTILCIECFKGMKDSLKQTKKCPSCENEMPCTAYSWIVSYNQAAHELEENFNDLDQLD